MVFAYVKTIQNTQQHATDYLKMALINSEPFCILTHSQHHLEAYVTPSFFSAGIRVPFLDKGAVGIFATAFLPAA